jgi:glyoxylate reductase
VTPPGCSGGSYGALAACATGSQTSGVPKPVLVAAEVRSLLAPADLSDLEVTWLAAGDATPAGSWLGLAPLLTRRVGARELDALPALRVVANVAVGYDNVDLAAARARGIVVTNTPDVLTDATADLAWALLLACARRVAEGAALVREGRWTGWHPEQLLGFELSGRTLGILGAGRIGQAVGRRAVPFGMRLLYVSRAPKPEFERATGAVRTDVAGLFADSDVVSLHAPAVPELRLVVDAARLATMRPGAILINTARGELVDEGAVAAALESGRLGAAGLDVYAAEPRIDPGLLAAPRAVLLPHLGSATLATRRRMAGLALANLRAVLAGEPPPSPVA